MAKSKLDSGRINQKLRTRKALLEAAHRLIEQGRKPTLDEIAAEAMVSRATAYRYFPNRDALFIETPLELKVASPTEVMRSVKGASSGTRVAQVQSHLFDLAAQNEPQLRLYLRTVLDQWLQTGGDTDESLRGARRIAMLEEALRPFKARLGEETCLRLQYALASMTGIESFIVMRDVCGLDIERGKEIMQWAVQTLVDAVVSQGQAEPDKPA